MPIEPQFNGSQKTVAEAGTQTTTTTVIAPLVKNKKQWTRKAMGLYPQLVREEEENERFDQEDGPLPRELEEVRELKQEEEITWSLTSAEL